MWVETLSNGKVRYVERFINPLTLKSDKVSVTMDKDTKANQKKALTTLQLKIKEKTSCLKTKNLTLAELVELYNQDQFLTRERATYTRNCFATKRIIEILGANSMVDNLTAGYVRKQLTELQEKPGTTNERLKRFKALIRWGYNNDYIEDIRWIDKLIPLKDEEKVKKLEDKYLEAEELSLLLQEMTQDKWRYLTELTALSGLRCGEAIALEISDIDLDNRVIRVTKTYDSVNKMITNPKTATSVRDVYMQDELLALCKRILLYMKKDQILYGYRTKLFLSDEKGNYLHYYAYNKYLGELSLKLFGKKVTTHFMRHTHVSLLAEQGISFDAIARRIGHTNSQLTSDIYFHVTQKLRAKDNMALKEVKIL